MGQEISFVSALRMFTKNVRARPLLLLALYLILGGLALELLRSSEIPGIYNFPFGLLSAAVGATLLVFLYLQGASSRPARSTNDQPDLSYVLEQLLALPDQADFDRLSTELKELKISLADQQLGLGLDDKYREEILQALKRELAAATGNQLLVAIEEKYAPAVIRQTEYNRLLADFDSLKTRLNAEVQSLNRRANSNLAFGSVLTFVAMAGLTYVVLKAEVNYQDVTSVLHYYIPRLSFVIFIEVFAYFFLKLYKSNLSDTKYYQNELTNVESKMISLKSALLTQDKSAAKAIITELSKTERNFILKKGESTVDLEKAKLDVKQIKDILNFGTSLTGSKKAGH